MIETLEELKAIVENSENGDLFYDGRYLNERLHVRHYIKKYHQGGTSENVYYDAPLYVDTGKLSSLSDMKRNIEVMETNQQLQDKINQLDKAITDIGNHIQKSEPSFSMAGVDIGDSQKRIIEYIRKLEVL